MKKSINAIVSCICLLLAVSSASALTKSVFQGEKRQVSGFNGITSSGSFDVNITMGNTESLTLSGDRDVISEIETKVEDGILKIRYKNNKNVWKWNDKGKVTVNITAKSLSTLTLSGSGDMRVKGTIKGDDLDTKVSGSGNMALAADVEEFKAQISGSGEMEITGSAAESDVSVSGSGNFSGKNFKTGSSNIAVSGSGNVSIYADKSLNARVSGSGNVRYGGNADVSAVKSGSGSVTKL